MVIYPTTGSTVTTGPALMGSTSPPRVRISNSGYGSAMIQIAASETTGCSWDLLYDSSPTTATTLSPIKMLYSGGAASCVSNNLYCKVWDETGDWYRIENGAEAFGTPCNSAVAEWAWVDDGSTHECTTAYKWAVIKGGYINAKPLSPEEQKAYNEKMLKSRFQKIIQQRCAPNIIVRNSKRQPLPMPADIREQRARDTLRRVIGDNKFANFLKHGFISIKARSGLIYQIFPGHGFTNVYNQGQMVECLCVVLQGDFPPTDSLIMRYLLILNNEQQFRSYANKQSVHQPNRSRLVTGEVNMKSLTEIYQDLKKIA